MINIIRLILYPLYVSSLIIISAFSSFAEEPAAYPLIVRHALGETAVTAPPQRVVTIGWSGEDVVLALGVIPVGMTHYELFPTGIFPWNEEALGKFRPVLLSDSLIDFEAIAVLRPDLILGVYSGIDEVSYKRLSAIAPTVVYRSGPWLADWKEQATIIGEALGKKDAAERLVESTVEQLRLLGTKHPSLRSKTFIFGSYFPGGSGIVLYLPHDPRVAALTELGLAIPPFVGELAARNPDQFSVLVSFEELHELDPDLIVMWFKPGAREALEAQQLFTNLVAFKRGAYLPLEDAVSVWATSALSVQSIPYFYPRFAERLAAAANAKDR